MTAVDSSTPATGEARRLVITGFGVLCGTGIGPDLLAAGVAAGSREATDVSGMFTEPLPRPDAHSVADFRAREHLGRKGTSTLDRATALSIVAGIQALTDAGLVISDQNESRCGLSLGTTHGSLRSTSDYSRDTFVEERPYHVNPALFPNAVMNSAAGQAAIRIGLKGPNATVAGGSMALLQALRYSRIMISCGYADVLLTGAAEELSPQTAWAVHYAQQEYGGAQPVGEGAAFFVVEDAAGAKLAGRTVSAEVLAVEIGCFLPPWIQAGHLAEGLAGCLRRALRSASLNAADVGSVVTAANGMTELDAAEQTATDEVFGPDIPRLRITDVIGETVAASGALQLAAVLAQHRASSELDGKISAIVSRSADGSAGVTLVRGWSRS